MRRSTFSLPRKAVLAGAIGFGLVSTIGIGTAAYATFDKAVTLTVDGKARTVHTFGSTVGDVLAAEKLSVGQRDAIAPGAQTKLNDGTEISVRFARPVELTLDGKRSTKWVTALSVGSALDQLSIRHDGARLSVSRSLGIGRQGLALDVKTPKHLTVIHDGEHENITAPVLTVGEALTAANVTLDGDDRIAPELSTRVEDGATIRVQRVAVNKQKVSVDLPFKTVRKADSSMYKGKTKVVRAGKKGIKTQLVEVTTIDGRKRGSKVLSQTVSRKPVDKIVAYGTKKKSTPGPDVGGSVDNLNWAALAECESGGNPRAVNPNGHYGLYQFSLSTWRAVGGSGNPIDASSAEQTYRAKVLYQKAGAGQWSCGSHLYD